MEPTLHWLTTGEKAPKFTFEKPIGGKFTKVETADFAAWRKELARTEDIYQDGYLSIDWIKDANRLTRVNTDGLRQLQEPNTYGIGGVRYRGSFANDLDELRFMANLSLLFQNVLCELDMPGEWYFDRKEKVLYIYPITEDYKNTPLSDGKYEQSEAYLRYPSQPWMENQKLLNQGVPGRCNGWNAKCITYEQDRNGS